SKNNPRNIKHMPVVIFFVGLDLKQKASLMDGHYLKKPAVKRQGVLGSFLTSPYAFKQCTITLLMIHFAIYKVLKEGSSPD
ncbi:hypothetical protein C6A37_10770, partial [Desulfobacteraceae bacterium SEEP-SAG9]